jgi:hypothetical protein
MHEQRAFHRITFHFSNAMNAPLPLLLLVASLALAPTLATAQAATEVDKLRAGMLMLTRTLLDKNLITVAKAQELLREAGIDPSALGSDAKPAPLPPVTAAAPPAPPVVRVPYVSETVKREMREELRQEVLAQARAERWGDPGALPSWLSRIAFSGDVRVRLQRDAYPSDNDTPQLVDTFYQLPADSTRNTTEDRDRLRLRARLGVQARVSDSIDAGLRIVTSSGDDANNPVSTNVDLGRSARRPGVALDQAYVGWSSGFWSARGGRIANPYLASDLMWAQDLSFDGVAATWAPVFSVGWSGFATVGAHPLHEVAASPTNQARDKWLLAAQAGARWQGLGNSQARAGLALYDFRGVEGRLNPADPPGNSLQSESAPAFRQRGNTMFNLTALSNPSGAPVWGLASKFRVVNLSAGAEFGFFEPWRLGVNADWLRNIGFDREEILARIGPTAAALPQDRSGATGVQRRRTDGYRVEFSIGNGLRDLPGSWQVFAGYRLLQRDAVPDAFTSADYRLGGTDQRASFLGASVNLARETALTARYVNAESLDLAPSYRVHTWTFDLSTRF